MLVAVAAKYFPPSGSVENYCNNPVLYNDVLNNIDTILPTELVSNLNQTGRVPVVGDIKYIFTTKPGPGPIRQPLEEALIDYVTGLPREPGPKHRRMKI